ncbi:MAG TPA: RNA 2',3'-cyclic phosphodiesterase [Pyrinomonadaceae bacterium]|nr:RNA 2',3'-cyclic phosphodiesterase [Pyrinomonadaceae bacterium]
MKKKGDQPSVRVFCAVELPLEVRERIAEAIARLREAAPGVRASWERTEKLHITLKFLGEIEQERVEALSNAAQRSASVNSPFTLKVEGAGAFPPRGLPRVLWLGIADSQGALTRLQKSLEDECAAEGFAREERPFRPHLTLARIRAPQGARELAQLHQENNFEPVEFPVSDLTVLRSDLAPVGSRYTEISSHVFGVIQSL